MNERQAHSFRVLKFETLRRLMHKKTGYYFYRLVAVGAMQTSGPAH